MATQKGKDAFAFVKDFLNKRRDASFAEVRDAGKAAGHKIFPIVYGRAQLLLGHVKAGKKKGSAAKKAAAKNAAAKKAATQATAKAAPKTAASKATAMRTGRGPGRPRKVAATSGLGGLDAIVQHVRGLERERDQLRSTIEKLRTLLSSV